MNNEKIYLATTALEETWDNSADKIIFLGTHCLLYPRRGIYTSDRYKTIPSIWDQDKLNKAEQFCKNIYAKKLSELACIYNDIFNIKEESLYYNRIFGFWLLSFICIIYDKYLSIINAYNTYPKIYSFALSSTKYFVPYDNLNFINNVIRDPYSFQLYSQIIRELGFSNIEFCEDINFYSKDNQKKSFFKDILFKASLLFNKIFQTRKVIVAAPYFKKKSLLNMLYLIFKSKFKCVLAFFDISLSEKENMLNNNFRNLAIEKLENLQTNNLFEKILNKMIALNIPMVYLDYFSLYRENIQKYKSLDADIYFTANFHYFNTFFQYKVASSYNSKYLIMQHGGGYYYYINSFDYDFESKIADKFYSFGWANNKNVKYLHPSIFTHTINRKEKKVINQIFFSSNTISRYLRNFIGYGYFGDGSEDMYIAKRHEFLLTLNSDINIKVRMYPTDSYMLYEKERMCDFNFSANIEFDDYKKDFYHSLKQCKLFVTDIAMTTFLEALYFNIPTVLFDEKIQYALTDNASLMFKKLIDVNIVFYSAIEAARFINKNYNSIKDWWDSSEVQKAREEFCFQYARKSNNWADEWVKEFNSVLEEQCKNKA